MDDELARAIVQSLSNSSPTLTPTSLAVSNLEQKLEQQGLHRQKLDFMRKVNDLIFQTEYDVLNLGI